MTKRAGPTKYARIALIGQMLLLGVIVGELVERSRPPSVALRVMPCPPAPPPPIPTNRLQTRVPDIEFNGAALSDVLWELANLSGENLGTDWPDLQEDLGVLPTDAIHLQMKNPTLAAALDEICRQLHRNPPRYATYGEGGGGIIVVGSADLPGDVPLPTIASVFDVHDLLHRPAKVQPPPQLPRYEIPADIEARADLRELADALKTLRPDILTASFGTRLIIFGTPQASRQVMLALDAIRHPVPFAPKEDLQSESGPLRIIMPGEMAAPLIAYWRSRFANDMTFRISGDAAGSPNEPVIVSVSGIGFDDLHESIQQGLFKFPYLFIAPGELDEFGRVRRAKLEDGPRAYDVTTILAASKGWMTSANSNGGQPARTLKEEQDALAELIQESDPDAWAFELPEGNPIAFWNGLLIVRQDPMVQRHIRKFLEHLQRTGRPFDPPPGQ